VNNFKGSKHIWVSIEIIISKLGMFSRRKKSHFFEFAHHFGSHSRSAKIIAAIANGHISSPISCRNGLPSSSDREENRKEAPARNMAHSIHAKNVLSKMILLSIFEFTITQFLQS
jgi:hypothetical protein